MANGFRVQSSSIKGGCDQLSQLNERFNIIMNHLTSDLQQLSSQWEGDAKNKFNANMTNDIENMKRFYTTMQQYIQALTSIGNQYNNTESTNVGLIK